MRKDLPDHFKRWLGMGGKVYFAHSHSGVTGYIRAFNRTGALRIAKAHGVTVGSVMDQRTLAGALESIGVKEIGASEVYRGNPARRRRVRSNPAIAIFGNPGRGGKKLLSRRAIDIAYIHVEDGQAYRHKFGSGDVIELSADGKSVTIRNKNGKQLWRDF